mgnify:CR=1 FL=1
MKKRTVLLLLAVALALLLALSVWLCVRFVRLYSSSSDLPPAVGQDSDRLAVEGYVRQSWPEYGCSYDAQSATLTVTRTSALSYETAVTGGARIYCDETAPQTYQATAELLRLDVMAQLAMDRLTVVLRYDSTDGRPIFTVSSSGEVWTCWE